MYNDKEAYAEPERVGSKLPLSSQEKILSELHDTISQLTVRLKPVLTPVPEIDRSATEDRSLPSQSPLADQIDANNRGFSSASRKLRDLMERLEC